MKYVLVTGASGGMGQATVKKLAELGYFCFSLDKVKTDASDNIYPIEADITDEESIKNAFLEVQKVTPKLYAIIHFAGIYIFDSLVEVDSARYEKIFKVNVIGPYLINKNFLPLLGNDSRIIMTTSELATRDPLPFTGIYGITKGALDKYAYSLSMELQLKGIKVSVIRPGAVKTKMLDVSTKELDEFCNNTKLYKVSSKNFKNIVGKVESKYITPELLARKVVKVLNKKNPRFNYAINRHLLLIIFDLFPKRIRFKIIKSILSKKEK